MVRTNFRAESSYRSSTVNSVRYCSHQCQLRRLFVQNREKSLFLALHKIVRFVDNHFFLQVPFFHLINPCLFRLIFSVFCLITTTFLHLSTHVVCFIPTLFHRHFATCPYPKSGLFTGFPV